MKKSERKALYDVVMTDFGREKVKVIAHVRGITGLGLADTKKLVENLPALIKKDASGDDAGADRVKPAPLLFRLAGGLPVSFLLEGSVV